MSSPPMNCYPLVVHRRWTGGLFKISKLISFKKSVDFVQKVPPIYNFSVFEGRGFALASLGLGKNENFIRIFTIQKQYPVRHKAGRALNFSGILDKINSNKVINMLHNLTFKNFPDLSMGGALRR